MEQVQQNLIRVEQVLESNGKHYLKYAEVPDHLSTLQSLLDECQDQVLPEAALKQIAKQLLNMMKVFSGMLKHLHPARIFLNKNNFQEDFKVLCGDEATFSEFDLT